MKKLIVIIIGVMITVSTWGAKAYPEPFTITQKDGKQLTYQLYGDEHFNYAATTDGVLLYQEGRDLYIAVIDENGEMKSSGVLAHNPGQRTAEEITLIGKQDKNRFFTAADAKQAKKVLRRVQMTDNTTTLFPHTGSPKALVILADFQDQKFKHDNEQTTWEIFNQYLNAEGRPDYSEDKTLKKNIGSVRKYFSDMSGGAFTPQFDLFRTIVHLSENMAVYGPGKNDNMSKFIPEVCTLAQAAGVDFSKYDEDEDGYVDLVYVIYAGYGQSTGGGDDTIWPKSGPTDGESNFGTFDGKIVCRYGVHSELNFNPSTTEQAFNNVPQINGIGLFCHEFSHCLGLPDIYPTYKAIQDAGNPAMEFWDVMDGGEYSGSVKITVNGQSGTLMGGYSPTAYTAWEREYMGWKEMEVLKDNMIGQQITMKHIDATGGIAYKIFPDDNENGNEYVCIQNIQASGWNNWLASNLGHGLLITYVNYDADAFSLSNHSPNNVLGHSRMTIIPADNEFISSYLAGTEKPYTKNQYYLSHRGDPFPGTSDVHDLYSMPMICSGTTMDKPLLNIQENNNIISFYYQFEPAQKVEDNSEENKTEELTITTESTANQIIKTHMWEHDNESITHGYQVKNFEEVNFAGPTDVSDCNILSFCVKALKAMKLKITLLSGAVQAGNAKAQFETRATATDVGDGSYSQSFDLEAGEWRTIAIQLSTAEAHGVDLSNISAVVLTNDNEQTDGDILFVEDMYFCESTKRGIATTIRNVNTASAMNDKTKSTVQVYTLDGRYIGSSLKGLAKGIYIVNGKKTVIR